MNTLLKVILIIFGLFVLFTTQTSCQLGSSKTYSKTSTYNNGYGQQQTVQQKSTTYNSGLGPSRTVQQNTISKSGPYGQQTVKETVVTKQSTYGK
jgi:hypothetical protein